MPADYPETAGPVRTCVGCRGRYPKRQLKRYVWGGTEPLADPEQRLQGRGAYCCKNERCPTRLHSARRKWAYIFRLS